MKYSFYRICRLWRSAAKMYSLVILEMAVGTALLVTCLNMVFQIRTVWRKARPIWLRTG